MPGSMPAETTTQARRIPDLQTADPSTRARPMPDRSILASPTPAAMEEPTRPSAPLWRSWGPAARPRLGRSWQFSDWRYWRSGELGKQAVATDLRHRAAKGHLTPITDAGR